MHSADLFPPAGGSLRSPPADYRLQSQQPRPTLYVPARAAFILREAVRAYLKTRSNTDGPFKHIICNSSDSLNCDHYLPERYSSIPRAPARPASIARITVAAPVTASPPAYTPSFVVFPSASSAIMHFQRFTLSPSVVADISGFGEVPSAMITVSASILKSEPAFSTGLLLHEMGGRALLFCCNL